MVTLPSQSFQQGCLRVLRNPQTDVSMLSASRQVSRSQQTCRPVNTHAPLPCTSRTGGGCLSVCATPMVNCLSTRSNKSSGSSWVLLGCPLRDVRARIAHPGRTRGRQIHAATAPCPDVGATGGAGRSTSPAGRAAPLLMGRTTASAGRLDERATGPDLPTGCATRLLLAWIGS